MSRNQNGSDVLTVLGVDPYRWIRVLRFDLETIPNRTNRSEETR